MKAFFLYIVCILGMVYIVFGITMTDTWYTSHCDVYKHDTQKHGECLTAEASGW